MMMAVSEEGRKKLAVIIAESAAHARTVSVREHIKADRHGRVGNFITSLRRGVTAFDSKLSRSDKENILSYVCVTRAWYDIGVVASNYSSVLEECIRTSNNMTEKLDVQVQTIHMGLEKLASELLGAVSSIDDVNRINQESEAVISGLEEIFA